MIAFLVLAIEYFTKSMPSDFIPGLFQDVYHPLLGGRVMYVKLQIDGDAVIISFKHR